MAAESLPAVQMPTARAVTMMIRSMALGERLMHFSRKVYLLHALYVLLGPLIDALI